MHLSINTGHAECDFCDIFNAQISKTLSKVKVNLHQKPSYDLLGKVMQTGLVMWTTEKQRRANTSSSAEMA